MAKKSDKKNSKMTLEPHEVIQRRNEINLNYFIPDLPDEESLVIKHVQYYMKQEAVSKYEQGRGLLWLQAKMRIREAQAQTDFQALGDSEASVRASAHLEAGVRTFGQLLEEEFGGMPRRTAYDRMAFAKKCFNLPKIKEFGDKNWSKVTALLHGTTDEQLKDVEVNGILGIPLDEFDGLTVKQFKEEIKKLRHDTDKIVKEETKTIEAEKKALICENQHLRSLVSPVNTPEEFKATWDNCIKGLEDVMRKLNHLDFDPVHDGDNAARRTYFIAIGGMEMAFAGVIETMKDKIL